jgi:hypothetical protein
MPLTMLLYLYTYSTPLNINVIFVSCNVTDAVKEDCERRDVSIKQASILALNRSPKRVEESGVWSAEEFYEWP